MQGHVLLFKCNSSQRGKRSLLVMGSPCWDLAENLVALSLWLKWLNFRGSTSTLCNNFLPSVQGSRKGRCALDLSRAAEGHGVAEFEHPGGQWWKAVEQRHRITGPGVFSLRKVHDGPGTERNTSSEGWEATPRDLPFHKTVLVKEKEESIFRQSVTSG